MSMKTSKIVMKCLGGTLAFCSAVAMAGGYIAGSTGTNTKKMMKKTANKLSDLVDTVTSIM